MPLTRELYEERKKKGLCVQCGEKADGKVRCQDCQEKNQKARERRREKRKSEGKCTECSKPAMAGCALCEECSKTRSETSTKRYYENKKAGKCRLCGAETNGESRCAKHKQQLKNWRKNQGR